MAIDVHIGGRLETVSRKPVTDAGDRLRLLALLVISVAVHGWIIAHTAVTARDSIGFARYALQLEDPNNARTPSDHPQARLTLVDVLRRAEHPPGYPIAVLFTSWVVRSGYAAPLPDQMLLSTQIASGLAGVLLVLPTYWLGRTLFNKSAGFIAALLVQLLPTLAQITSDGLTEAWFLLLLSTALLLAVQAIKQPSIGGFLLCGLATGVCYLIRPEGLLAAAALGLTAVGLTLVRRWLVSASAARITALAVGVILPALPYMILIGGISNKPTGLELLKIGNLRSKLSGAPIEPPLFAAWYSPASDGPKAVWAITELTKETIQAFHYFSAGLAVLGFILALRRLRAEPWLWVPVLFCGMTAVVLLALGLKKDYLSERHTLPLVYVGILFAAYGLLELPGLMGRISLVGAWPGHPAMAWVLLAAIVVSCLPKLARPLHANRAGHVAAGRFLAEPRDPNDPQGPRRLSDEDTLLDPFEWVQFYSGRTIKAIPPDPAPLAGRYRWAVLERGEPPHSHLHRYQAAVNVVNDRDNPAEVVFWWPKEEPVEKARVLVYRQKITPADEARWREADAAARAAAAAQAGQ